MHLPMFLSSLLLLGTPLVIAQTPYLTGVVGNTNVEGNGTGANAEGKWMIQSDDIRAYFIPYGASLTNLFINDTTSIERDVVLGYDNATFYTDNLAFPRFGGVPGRYANRIKNSTINVNGYTYNLPSNDGKNNITQDGGPGGWERRNWTMVSHTTSSITFSLHDQDGEQGFPGEVMAYVTYTLTPAQWHIRMVAMSLTKVTPIMLTSNVYWNLDGFQNPDTSTIFNHTLSLPYSGQRVDIDNIKVPTGTILPNQLYSVNDFWSHSLGKQLGGNLTSKHMVDNCGLNCTGYDNCFLINREAGGDYFWLERGPVATLRSKWSGITLDVYTDQDALQLYTCNGMDGTVPVKRTQGLEAKNRVVHRYGCVAIGVEDWIGAVNQPEWGRAPKQNFGPRDPAYTLQAAYEFSVRKTTTHCTFTTTRTTSTTTTQVSTVETTTSSTTTVEATISTAG